MKTQNLSKLMIGLLILCGSLSSCNQRPVDQSIIRSTKHKNYILEAYQKMGVFGTINYIPGMAVAVSIDNQVVWADGFGYSSPELKAKALPSHKFRIGQITELITTLTAAKLYENGLLKFDCPVQEIIPGLSKNTSNYTIQLLGSHAAGLSAENTSTEKNYTPSIDSIVASFVNNELLYNPGSGVLHSEFGFDLIGYIIEKTQQKSYPNVVSDILTDTLKLTETCPDNLYSIIDNKSSFYDYDYISQPIVAKSLDLRGKEASNGYLSSVTDLVKMGNLLIYPGFLKQETINLITKPFTTVEGKVSQSGFGLIVGKDSKGQTFYGQRGMIVGGSSALLIYPDDKLVIAMACNIGNGSWDFPIFEIASIFQSYLHPEKKDNSRENQPNQSAPSLPNENQK